jgi:small subunit ribosomal protein S14
MQVNAIGARSGHPRRTCQEVRMAKLSSINKNERRKLMVKKFAAKYAKLKGIANDFSVPDSERLIARLKMAEIPRNANPTRVRNRCELTGRPRAYYRKFRLSRVMLRDLAVRGQIPGVRKSSW